MPVLHSTHSAFTDDTTRVILFILELLILPVQKRFGILIEVIRLRRRTCLPVKMTGLLLSFLNLLAHLDNWPLLKYLLSDLLLVL